MSLVLFDAPGPRARRRARIGGAVGILAFAGLLAWIGWRLNDTGQFDGEKWAPFKDSGILRALARGLGATVRAALFAVLFALVLGVVLAAGRLSKVRAIRWPTVAFVEFFRATPVVLLILFLFFGFSDDFARLGDRWEARLQPWAADILGVGQLGTLAPLVLALTLYNGAVLAEIFRAGILAVPRGQREAAEGIGLTERQIMRIVLLPQATRIMLPAIVSQSIVALKDTALGFIIAYPELVRVGRLIYDSRFNIIPTAIVVTAIYVTLNLLLEGLATWLSRRQSRRYSREAVAQAQAAAGGNAMGGGAVGGA
ncbi:MAG: amino acid ABC transporter permease [Sporichthyaceae bacterium]